MQKKTLIRHATLVYGKQVPQRRDILIEEGIISLIGPTNMINHRGCHIIEGKNLYILPGIIDINGRLVSFEKNEQCKKIASGITSTLIESSASTLEELEALYKKANGNALYNYSFYMGETQNTAELLSFNPSNVCGVFLGKDCKTVCNTEKMKWILDNICACPIVIPRKRDFVEIILTSQRDEIRLRASQSSLPLSEVCTVHNEHDLIVLAQKYCNIPADIFEISKRGYIQQGYYADLILINLNKEYYPLPGESRFPKRILSSFITHVMVNGIIVYQKDVVDESKKGVGERLTFTR